MITLKSSEFCFFTKVDNNIKRKDEGNVKTKDDVNSKTKDNNNFKTKDDNIILFQSMMIIEPIK